MRRQLRLKGLGCLATLPGNTMAAPYLCVQRWELNYQNLFSLFVQGVLVLHSNLLDHFALDWGPGPVVCCGIVLSLAMPNLLWVHTFDSKTSENLFGWDTLPCFQRWSTTAVAKDGIAQMQPRLGVTRVGRVLGPQEAETTQL